ncbi:MAG TPA: DUF1330 domain-containing protein [Dehalococcoidia bacterium]|jgi:uncharacterized protein (DUF1330 family)
MPAYVIVEIETHDPELMARYRELAAPTIAARGGTYVVRGGACETLEGGWAPERIVVLRFDDMAQARAWWECDEYRDLKEMRYRAGQSRMILVDGLE